MLSSVWQRWCKAHRGVVIKKRDVFNADSDELDNLAKALNIAFMTEFSVAEKRRCLVNNIYQGIVFNRLSIDAATLWLGFTRIYAETDLQLLARMLEFCQVYLKKTQWIRK